MLFVLSASPQREQHVHWSAFFIGVRGVKVRIHMDIYLLGNTRSKKCSLHLERMAVRLVLSVSMAMSSAGVSSQCIRQFYCCFAAGGSSLMMQSGI